MSDLTLVDCCRSCGAAALIEVLSLGRTPLANALASSRADHLLTYPLTLVRCTACSLAQLAEIVDADALFSDYIYFSSTSETMLRHSEVLVDTLARPGIAWG